MRAYMKCWRPVSGICLHACWAPASLCSVGQKHEAWRSLNNCHMHPASNLHCNIWGADAAHSFPHTSMLTFFTLSQVMSPLMHWLHNPIHRHRLPPLLALPCSSPPSFFSLLSSPQKTQALAALIHNPPLFLLSFLLSYFLSFLICTPEGFVCLLTSWSKASAGLRLAPIIRAWQGAAVSTCQPNKHPLWHRPGCVLRGVSQPPSSGPLISWMALSAHTSTRLLCSGQAAIVLPCTAILKTLILLEAFRLVWDMVLERKAERERIKQVSNTGQVWQCSGQQSI